VVLVVGDVAGKGLTSALVGTSFRSALRAMVHANLSLYEIATQMNVLHYSEGAESRRRYVTAMLMRLDPKTDVLEVINAGHNPGFLRMPDGTLTTIVASGTPIGILPFSSYVPEKFVLEPGARLLIYTDGMTEVFCAEEEFGERRLLQTFVACEEKTPDGALDHLWRTLEEFSCGGEQSDDMTALVLFRTS
jgi:serine phosphatase RsbU (regulator of sigma subunit)